MSITPQQILDGAVTGAKAGMQATVPMGATMRLGMMATSSPSRVPFSAVMKTIEKKVGLQVTEPEHVAASWAGHMAYGAAFGALFGAAQAALPQQARTTGVSTAIGAAFGLSLWAASYLGWLPAMGIMKSARKSSAGFNATNIAAHLVWGGATGAKLGRALPVTLDVER